MATTLKHNVTFRVSGSYDDTTDVIKTITSKIDESNDIAYTNGTTANKVDQRFTQTKTLLTATAQDYDLAGALTNEFGVTMTFVKVKGIALINRSTTPGDFLWLGGDATAALVDWVENANDRIKVGPGGHIDLESPIDGYTVTPTTADILQVENPGLNSVTFKIVIVGTTA
jgi:hypothetical protein